MTTIRHYNRQQLDLLDIVIKHGHAYGFKVHAGVRLNHANSPAYMHEVPGPDHYNGMRKDFRNREFQRYLLDIYEDLTGRGLDGLTLDFERKAPFFPDSTPKKERFGACTALVRSVRGQEPIKWMQEGLLDAVIPATHNHEPDGLDWDIERFVEGACRSPRPCRIWPQIWPTVKSWTHPGFPDDTPGRWHSPDAVLERVHRLIEMGADGVYFFNFFPWPENGRVVQKSNEALKRLP